MKPKRFHHHKDKKYRRIAAAFAGAALMSAALFSPGVSEAAPPPADPAVAAAKPAGQNDMSKQIKVEKKSEQDQKARQAEKTSAKSKQTKTEKNEQAKSNAKQTLNVTATAYAPGAHDNDQWGDKTYLGTQIRPGIIAVDPDVIPLGSKVYIEFPNGDGMHAVAEDTGGAIKGNRIDIAKWSVNEAEDFGMKDVKVHVLSRGNA